MSNSILTAQQITRKALEILHAKLNFIGTVNRQYDDSFATKGAKIGSQLKIRLPNEYTVRTGRTFQGQSTNETSETLTVATQKGVDSEIFSDELAMSMDDFTSRILEPQMSVLASNIEHDALSMALDVANVVGTPGTTPGSESGKALLPWLQAKQRLDDNLATNGKRCVQMDGDANAETVNGLSTFFNPTRTLNKQFMDGWLGQNSGLDYFYNSMLRRITTGSREDGTVNGAGQGGDGSVVMASVGVAGTGVVGDKFTVVGVYDVHPETKQAWGRLKQFVVTAAFTASAGEAATVSFSPSAISSGARQNVSAAFGDGAVVTWLGSASTSYPLNMAYCENAFAFVSADLDIPKGMDMAYRTNKDGIAMRFIRGFDIKEDEWVSRFDVLYGFKTLRQVEASIIWG